ncbi:MAG: UPF0175 family protein [Verrucomicrobia bacterium]|nr:UPF0175 family protein [Verrucomicrobiota bacterium]
MKSLTLEIQPQVCQALRLPPEEVPGRLRSELAIRLYAKGILPLGRARSLAGLSKWRFHALLAQEGALRHYDAEEFETDLRTLDTMG